jgi:hypothetical protein
VRLFNRVLSLLLGLGLIVAGLLAIIEVVAFTFSQDPVLAPAEDWLGALRTTPFSERGPLLVFAGLALAGLVLLVAEARPWPKRRAQLDRDELGSWWVLRRSVEQAIRRMLTRSTSAVAARAKLKPKARSWRLAVQAEAAEGSRPDIEQRARAMLLRLGAPDSSNVKVRVRRRRRVS